MIDKKYIENTVKNKRLLNRLFVVALLLLEILILAGIVLLFVKYGLKDKEKVFNLFALALILVWFGILTAYYAWAIYFYNINLGLTNQDWAKIREKKEYMPEGEVEEPKNNPNAAETLGLPPGTVRGTIAITLLVGGLAMAIASLGMNSSYSANSFIVDNFEFFKTAFLMMIAFYFGSKSLEILGKKTSNSTDGKTNSTTNGTQASNNGTSQGVPPQSGSSEIDESGTSADPVSDKYAEDFGSTISSPENDFDRPNSIG